MKRLLHLALWLYPPWWRRRYGPELEAVIEDAGLNLAVLSDVLIGALSMQTRTMTFLPVVGAVIGMACGALVVWRSPALYISTSTVRFERSKPLAVAESPLPLRLRTSLEEVTGSDETRRATAVEVVDNSPIATTLRVTYGNPSAAEAQRVAQSITAAVAASANAAVISNADLPTSPVRPLAPVAAGSALGLLIGAVVTIAGSRREPIS